MKSIPEITEEINQLIAWNPEHAEAKTLKRFNFLKSCKLFLERAPVGAEEQLKRQLSELTSQKEAIANGYDKWKLSESRERKSKEASLAEYRKEMDWKKINEQIETLTYLLG